MIGKKKSGFQITSVTSDYDGGSGEGLKEALNGEGEFGDAPLVNGGPNYESEGHPPAPSPAELAGDRTKPPSAAEMAGPSAGGEGVSLCDGRKPRADQEAPSARAAAPGPPTKDVTPPGTAPAAKAPLKTASPPTPTGGSCSSRFRVVKLDHGLGEPYRRGRWTCVDLYDWDLDSHVLAKVLDGARPVNSLDSHLELSSFTHKAVSQLRPKLHAPKSQGSPLVPYQMDNPRGKAPALAASSTLNMLIQAARTLSLDGQAATSHQPGMPAPASPPRGSPHLPAGRANVTGTPKEAGASKSADGSVRAPTPREEAKAQLPGSKAVVGEPAASSNVKQPSGEQGAVRKYSEPRSTSVSPGPLSQDGSSPSRKTRASEPNTAAASLRFVSPMQTLAKSMLSVGTQQDSDDDSGSSSSMVAIDNKIEQAMDLVKSHLMYAVREEVEVLKEQIKELVDRNTHLEQENSLLKSLANPDQLSQLQTQLRSAGSSTGSSGSSPANTA